jgi:hypothetical protein
MCTASIFRVMMMEAVCTSETSVCFNETVWQYIPEICHLHTCRCENLKSQLWRIIGTEHHFGSHCIWCRLSVRMNLVKGKAAVPATCHGGAWGERRYSSHSFSTSALDGGEWSASRPGRAFTPGERTPGTHCTGGWVGPRASLDTEARRKILCPRRGSNPDRPVVQPIVTLYCLS